MATGRERVSTMFDVFSTIVDVASTIVHDLTGRRRSNLR